jgi:hypothetical protein
MSRVIVGAGIAYGNSEEMPLSKQWWPIVSAHLELDLLALVTALQLLLQAVS